MTCTVVVADHDVNLNQPPPAFAGTKKKFKHPAGSTKNLASSQGLERPADLYSLVRVIGCSHTKSMDLDEAQTKIRHISPTRWLCMHL